MGRSQIVRLLGVSLIAVVCSACGGGGGSSRPAPAPNPNPPPPPPPSGWMAGVFDPSDDFKDLCEVPRVGNFPDMQGTTTDENNWLRSWSNELYLWYAEITDENPENFETDEYFELLKTFAASPSGQPKDKFHFTVPTDEWLAFSQSGITAGYGARFELVSAQEPREVVVAFNEGDANSPAALANLSRGAEILEIDGVDVISGTDVDTLNAGLFPADIGEDHEFVVRDLGAATTRTITMTSAEITIDPVKFVRTIDTASGPVGYLFFSSHIAPSEEQLIAAVETLAADAVTDLVLDLRYNGGGFLDIANELSYMIAGPAAADGRVFNELEFNDKHPSVNPVTGQNLVPDLFHEVSVGFSAPANEPLPTLDLPRVFILSGAGTCSASEAIINGLRGIGVEVIQIGDTTCGKPYGFYAFDNCGTTYFSIQFRGLNADGFGDFSDGFSPDNTSGIPGVSLPGCEVADDFGSALSSDSEPLIAAALDYRATGGGCPVVTTSNLPSRALRFSRNPDAGELVAPRWPGAVLRR